MYLNTSRPIRFLWMLIIIAFSCTFNVSAINNLSIAINRGHGQEYISPSQWNSLSNKSSITIIGVYLTNGSTSCIVKPHNQKLTNSQIQGIVNEYEQRGLSGDAVRRSLESEIAPAMDWKDASRLYKSSLPTLNEAKLTVKYLSELDNILRQIGGTPLGDVGYWSGAINGSKVYKILLWNSSSPLFLDSTGNSECVVRLVIHM